MPLPECLTRQVMALSHVNNHIGDIITAINNRRLQEQNPTQLEFLQGIEEQILNVSVQAGTLMSSFMEMETSDVEASLGSILDGLRSIEVDFKNNPVFQNLI